MPMPGELITIIITFILSVGVLYLIDYIMSLRTQSLGADGIFTDLGMIYDAGQDIFYTAMDAWQRRYGYCRCYEKNALYYGVNIDCEEIYFEYDNKKWIMCLRKGQYGAFTGGEIGVYTACDYNTNLSYKKTVYDVTDEENHLLMEFKLLRNDEVLFMRKDTHWQVTGFMPGKYSEPQELIMEICITFKTYEMLCRFTDALRRTGYTDSEYTTESTRVFLTYGKPRQRVQTIQDRAAVMDATEKSMKLCLLCGEKNNFQNSCEQLVYIRNFEPKLYKEILKAGFHKKLYTTI